MNYTDRKEIPDKYKWDLSLLIADESTWQPRLDAVQKEFAKLAEYKGRLANPQVLLDFSKLNDKIGLELETLLVYANMKSHEDIRISKYQQMVAASGMAVTEYMATISFHTPEIIASYSEEQLIELSKKPEFKDYSYQLVEYARQKDKVLSEKEETLLAKADNVFSTFSDTFSRFDNADIKWQPIVVDGKETPISHGSYGALLQSKNRKAREDAHFSMFNAYKDMINTIATNYTGNVMKDVFLAQIRGFDSCLSKALYADNIPNVVYQNLIDSVMDATKDLQEYFEYRRQKLGIDKHHQYDSYVPIVGEDEEEISFDDAFEIVLEGLAPMGEDYIALLKKAREERWIDVYETKGKRSGGYSWGVYRHPAYILLNFNGTLNETFTIAHELGHSMHSYHSDNALGYSAAGYRIFVAEIASTVNEMLLIKHLLKTSEGEKKKYLLTYLLDMFKSTVFRQTMFSEFERKAHEVVEKGEGLSAELLCNIYENLNKEFYGEDFLTPVLKYEWARIPHFYNSFYVYKYATGLISACAIASDILSGKENAVANYKKFLSAGGSMAPLDILKLANVDLTTKEPFEKAFALFKETFEELKSLD